MSIEEAILKEFNIKLPEGARISKTGEEIAKMPTPAAAKEAILNEDLRELFEPAIQKAKESKIPINVLSCLPRDLPNCRSGTTPAPAALVQVLSTRDATQPLRACGDLFEGEVPAGMTCTRNSTTRLLRLMVTDGVTEIPCLELSTLPMFSKKLPIPGEKLLLKSAQVKNGMIILEESTVKCLGGGAAALYDEYKMMTLAVQNRNAIIQTDAPKFSSLLVQVGNSANQNRNSHYQQQQSAGAAASSGGAGRQQQQQRQQNKNTQKQQNQRNNHQQQKQQRNQHQDPTATAMPQPSSQQQQQQHSNNNASSRGGGRGGQHQQQNQNQRGGRGGGRGGNNNYNNNAPAPAAPQQQQYQHHQQQHFNQQGGRGGGRGGGYQNQQHRGGRGGGRGGAGGGHNQYQQQQQQAAAGHFNWSSSSGNNNNNNNRQQGNVDARALHQACNAGLEDLGY